MYVAFVIDVFARLIVGWRATTSLTVGIALDALEQALHERRLNPEDPLVHHSDRGVQYVSTRYTERLAEAGIEPSVGSRGDSYDNALAESIIGLYKTEVIVDVGPGVVSKTLSSPPSSGSIGTTRNDSWSRSEMSPPSSTR